MRSKVSELSSGRSSLIGNANVAMVAPALKALDVVAIALIRPAVASMLMLLSTIPDDASRELALIAARSDWN